MLNWFRRKMADRQRKIFTFYDGCKYRSVDPLLIWGLINGHPQFDPQTHGPAFDRGDEEAYRIVLKCARDVFDIPAYSERGKPGLTEMELVTVFKQFLAYCDDLKKSINRLPISQPVTVESEQPQTGYIVPTSVSAVLPSTSTDKPYETPGCC